MKSSPRLRQLGVITNSIAEDAVVELVSRVVGSVPGSYTDLESGAVTVSVFTEAPDRRVTAWRGELRAGLRGLAELGVDPSPGRLRVRKVRPQDWAESWKRHFRPLEIGSALLVKPTWSRRQPKSGQALVLVDPGLSFGTGQHATTRFCLGELAAVRDPARRQSLLDAGTGSGILAIAAAKLGYRPVSAFDFDPDSVRIARENAGLNGVEALVRPTRADLTRLPRKGTRRYDVVCANLMYDLLIAERDRLLARLAPDGTLVLAGILHTQFSAVRRAYVDAGLRLVRQVHEGEWHSASFVRK